MKKSEVFLSKVETDQGNLLFRFSLGQALYEEGATRGAIPHLQLCTDSRDDWMLPRILLGKALLADGKPERAKPILEAALRLALTQCHEEPAAEIRELLADF